MSLFSLQILYNFLFCKPYIMLFIAYNVCVVFGRNDVKCFMLNKIFVL